MPFFKLENVNLNPNRNIGNYPVMEDKVDTLVESFKQTGVWPNMIARLMDNTTPDGDTEKEAVREWIEEFTAETPSNAVVDMEVELPFGTHRKEAAKKMGLETIFLNLQEIDDDDMLLMMIAENHSDFGGNVQTDVESIRAIWEAIKIKADTALTLDAFKAAYPDASKRMWNVCKSDEGPSYRFIQSVIGEKWAKNTIVFALNVLSDVRAGYYDQSTIFDFNNIALVGEYSQLARALYTMEGKGAAGTFFPPFYREEILREAVKVTNDEKSLVTVRIFRQAKAQACKGHDPLHVLRKGTNPSKPWSLKKYLDELTGAADSKIKLEEIAEHDGFAGFEGLEEAIEAVESSRAAEEGGDAPEGDNTDNPQAVVDAAANELEDAYPPVEGALDAMTEDGEVPFEFSSALSDANVNLAASTISLQAFRGKADDLEDEDKSAVIDVIGEAVLNLATVASEYTTKSVLKKLIDSAYKNA